MSSWLKRATALALLAAAFCTMGGCVYGPGYYQRPGVTYDDGNDGYGAVGGYDYDGPSYAPAYYGYPYGYGYYGGYYPWFGIGFSGIYYSHGRYWGHGGHNWHGGNGGWHGGSHGSSSGSGGHSHH